jgi:succinate dehydrogenase/fumarate reductase flavoprotein subunit
MVKTYTTDVLIIGTGGAGLRAAIEAEANNVDVILVSKAPAGYNNCTIVAGSGYLAAVGGMSVKEHSELTFRTGKRLNDPKLVKILTEEGGRRVLELEKYGCVVNVRYGGINVGDKNTILGQGITLPMVKYLKQKGVEFVENTIITKLLKHGVRVAGAIGYQADEEAPVLFQSKATILASGGAGALYKRTDCPLKTTGDGFSLALHAGARLRDMEFCQFFPLALAEPGQPALLVDGPVVEEGKIINTLGEDIPKKHGVTDRPFIAKSRDLLSRAMMMEILEGSGVEGAVLVDGREIFQRSRPGDRFGMGSYEFFVNKLQALERPFKVAPISHFTMGGIVANTNGETDIPGLFAVGEVMGGVHGANRHGGNALTDITVFGARAGGKAADFAKIEEHVNSNEFVKVEVKRYERMGRREIGFLPSMIMNLLRETMWEKVGIVRDSIMLLEAYEKINEFRDSILKLQVLPGRQMMDALELCMALDAAELIIRGAMERCESRGSHFRTDYPEEDVNWLKSIVQSKKGNAIHLQALPLNMVFD